MDLLRRARGPRDGPPRRRGGRGHRRAGRALERAPMRLRRAQGGRRPRRRRPAGLPQGPRGEVVAARPRRVHRRGAEDLGRQVRQEGAAPAVRRGGGGATHVGLIYAAAMILPRSIIPVAACVALLAGGCGSSGGSGDRLSKSDYQQQATKICTDSEKATNSLKQPTKPSDVKPFLQKGIAITQKAVNDFKALKPPASLQDEHN